MVYKINLQMHFYHESHEASVILNPVIPTAHDPKCELFLFSSLMMRQLSNLSWGNISRNIAYNLIWITKGKGREALTPDFLTDELNPERLTTAILEGEPSLVKFSGIPSKKHFLADLFIADDKGQLQIHPQGYSKFFDPNLNFDFGISPVLLLRYLAAKHHGDENYLYALCSIAYECGSKVAGTGVRGNHLTTAFEIAQSSFYWLTLPQSSDK